MGIEGRGLVAGPVGRRQALGVRQRGTPLKGGCRGVVSRVDGRQEDWGDTAVLPWLGGVVVGIGWPGGSARSYEVFHGAREVPGRFRGARIATITRRPMPQAGQASRGGG